MLRFLAALPLALILALSPPPASAESGVAADSGAVAGPGIAADSARHADGAHLRRAVGHLEPGQRIRAWVDWGESYEGKLLGIRGQQLLLRGFSGDTLSAPLASIIRLQVQGNSAVAGAAIFGIGGLWLGSIAGGLATVGWCWGGCPSSSERPNVLGRMMLGALVGGTVGAALGGTMGALAPNWTTRYWAGRASPPAVSSTFPFREAQPVHRGPEHWDFSLQAGAARVQQAASGYSSMLGCMRLLRQGDKFALGPEVSLLRGAGTTGLASGGPHGASLGGELVTTFRSRPHPGGVYGIVGGGAFFQGESTQPVVDFGAGVGSRPRAAGGLSFAAEGRWREGGYQAPFRQMFTLTLAARFGGG